jgi:alpha-tubulin suppressor-like RCC1 family protein
LLQKINNFLTLYQAITFAHDEHKYAMKKILFLTGILLLSLGTRAKHSFTRNRSVVKYRNDYHRVVASRDYTFEIRNGKLYAYGANSVGNLGIGNYVDHYFPVQVGTDSNWINVSISSQQHTLAIKSDGTLWAWGWNTYGELGIGNTTTQPSPVQVGTDHDWTNIASAEYSSFAIKADGSLWAWGNNVAGNLGIGNFIDQHSPVKVGADQDWVAVTNGTSSAYALKADGSLWAWGDNSVGELGLGDYTNRIVPTQVGSNHNWMQLSRAEGSYFTALRANGTLCAFGINTYGALGLGDTVRRPNPVQVGTDRDWVYVSTGSNTMALKANGVLWGWGYNQGCLGIGYILGTFYSPIQINNSNDWVDVFAAQKTFAMKTGGNLWCTGLDDYGQLGLGFAQFQPIDTYTATSTPAREWISGATGSLHTAALYSDGTLWTWGYNSNGQLGLGNTTEQHVPTKVGTDTAWVAVVTGSSHTLAMQSDGSIWAWGKNSDGQLGTGNNTEQHSPTQISGTWASVAAGDAHSLALKADGTLWAWGNNSSGQLGTGNYTAHNAPVQIGQDSAWIAISCGEGHSLGLKADGTLWSWGLNTYGELGTGNYTIQNAPVQVGTGNNWTAICAGANHSMALKADGTLWTWGQNSSGQLGNGNNTNYNTPQQVSGTNWIAMNAGALHSIAYKADGSIWSWGDNGYGQLGLGNNTNYNAPQQVTQQPIVHMFAGPEASHTGIIKDSRSLICLAGRNNHGQLGDSSILDKNTFACLNECVIPGVTINVSPNDSVCSSDTVKFTATITNGGPTPGYQWFKNNIPVGQNNSLYTVNPGGLNNGDVIKCVLTGSAACNVYPTDTSNYITMQVTQSVTPTITIMPDIGDTICIEHIVTYTATITNGGPAPQYQWYENNVPVGANTNTHQPALVNGNVVKCRLVSSAVCAVPDTVMSAPHTLMIAPVTTPMVTISANPSTVVTQNQSVTFTANVTNATNPQYQWKKNAMNIPGANQQTYTTNTLQMGDVISCRVRGLSICDTATAGVTMTVWPLNVANVENATMWVNVYPNPVNDVLSIDYDKSMSGEMELCDMAGKMLIQQPLSHSMDMKGLASGTYMLRVSNNEGLNYSKIVSKD